MKPKMNIKSLVKKVTKTTGLKIAKHSPELLIVGGVVSIIGATILACRATLKVEEMLDRHTEKMDQINLVVKERDAGEERYADYSDKDAQKYKYIVYVQTVVDFAKKYGPTILLMGLGFTCIFGAHSIMRKRNAAVTAALNATAAAFAQYRKRVVEEHGEEADYMYKNNIRKTQVTEEVVDPETGKKKKVTKDKYEVAGGTTLYDRWFDESSLRWVKDPAYNKIFVEGIERFYNIKLATDGYIFLSDIYDELGFPRTKESQCVGWIYKTTDRGGNGEGDGYIDFGLHKAENMDFMAGHERNILLTFNVDGPILDLI